MFKNINSADALGWFGLLILLLGFGGWVANIVKLFSMNLDAFSGWLILRVVGIVVPPLGSVLGFL